MRKRRKENGIALLISIFVLLLISVVAIAMIVASGTETSLAGNYRSSTNVYYAALAGLEEARGRLSRTNPDYVLKADAQFLPPPGTPLNVGDRRYILNPNPALNENMGNMLTLYPDNEYATEFTAAPNSTRTIASVSPNNAQGIPGPPFKWVRINAISEQWLRQGFGQDVAPFDGTVDGTPLFYDGANLTDTPSSGKQVLEITALAVLPNGSQKIVQYLAAPVPIPLPPFPAALTLAGSVLSNVVGYSAPATNAVFFIKGDDQNCSSVLTGSKFPAIGVFDSSDVPVVTGGGTVNGVTFTGIPTAYRTNYTGPNTMPDIEVIYGSFSPTIRTPAGLDAVMQTIIQNADATVPTTSASAETTFLSNLVSSGTMSSTSPLTVVVNGDLDLTGWHNTGYGLLLVTGNLTYDPDASWRGIVMVVGQGTVIGWKGGSGEFDGAMLVARTRDSSGNLLSGSYLGNSYVDLNHGASMGGDGIRYSNCWIQKAQPSGSYKIISFHEISQ